MGDTASASPVIPAAAIEYRDDQPYSLAYGDVYHAADGAAEVARVMIEPCGLDALARERARAEHPAERVVRIGELGFGSAFNFVVAAERCLAAGARLHFVSFEAAPLDVGDLTTIAARRRGAHPLYQVLADCYPPRIRGWHRRHLAGGRICLSVWWGAAADGLADLAGRQRQPFDAWFLDGFAPDRNPAMWEPALFERMASLSARGSRVATFTAAGRVRRALQAAGFAMRRVDQRPFKNESLAGTFEGDGLVRSRLSRHVRIAGAGLAGASAARHLARAGFQVTLQDPAGSVGAVGRAGLESTSAPGAVLPASLIPVTVLHGRLLADGSSAAELRCHGYLYAAAECRGVDGFAATGVLQVPGGAQPAPKLRALEARYRPSGDWLRWLDAEEAADLAGWPMPDGGLHFGGAGLVHTPALAGSLVAHPDILRLHDALDEPDPDEATILACGAATRGFAGAGFLELAPVHGQLDLVESTHRPALPLVGNGYLVPAGDLLAAGATYEYRAWEPEAATQANLAQLAGRPYHWRSRHRGTRCVSSDRTAVAGALPGEAADHTSQWYVSTGHGSAGNVSAHLAAAVVAALISGDFPPLARHLEAALAPQRFRERQARRGYRHGALPLAGLPPGTGR